MNPTQKSGTHAGLCLAALTFLTLGLAACGGSSNNGSSNMGTPLTPTLSLSVAPTTITVGQSATLTWSSTNASTCAASGAWSGIQAASGTQTVTPAASGALTYTLTCTAPSGGAYSGGGGGKISMSANLTANAASAFTATNLVADTAAAGALTTDPNLVNPWGIAFGPGPAWVANNHSETSTLYDGAGHPQPAGAPSWSTWHPGLAG